MRSLGAMLASAVLVAGAVVWVGAAPVGAATECIEQKGGACDVGAVEVQLPPAIEVVPRFTG